MRISDFQGGRYGFPGADDWYLFADYLGWSWAYAFYATGEPAEGEVRGIGGRPVLVASSFLEFIDLYIADSERLYAPAGSWWTFWNACIPPAR